MNKSPNYATTPTEGHEGMFAIFWIIIFLFIVLMIEAPQAVEYMFGMAILIPLFLVALGFLKALGIVLGRLCAWLISGLFKGFDI